jgi:hypothetical protein
MELKFTAIGSGAVSERLRRSRQPPTRAFSLVLGLIAAALVLGRAGMAPPPSGRIRWDQENIRFDAQNVGTMASRALTGKNVGGTGMVVGRLRLDGLDARDFRLEKDGCSGRKLAPNEACQALVVWQSKTPGRKTAQVLLDGEALAEPASVRVDGEALAPGPPIAEPTGTPTPAEPTASPTQAEPTASPTQAEPTASPTLWVSWKVDPFGPVRARNADGMPVRQGITLTNNTSTDVKVRLIADPSPIFRVEPGPCQALSGKQSCSATVVFTPIEFRPYSGTLRVFSSHFPEVDIPLSGEGVRRQ